ncbi:MAG: hypothetical protein JWP78_2925 [Mucilaginibacter sp.]|nr:hypothetical protein [Mucilaginibacter sp.]
MALSITALLFSSCLKDPGHVFNPEATSPNVAQFFNAGLGSFSSDAVTAPGLDTITFAVGVTLSTPPTNPTTATLAVDNSLLDAYNTANPAITYLPIPTAAYTLITSVTIPAGKNSTTTTVIIDRNQLDPTLSYMLPVKIASVSPNIPISANLGVHYFHIIGNDFAGSYTHDFTRIPAANFTGHTDVFFPDSPTQFEVVGGYYSQTVRYVVSFTKTGTGSGARYTNFQISLNSDDVKNILTPVPIAVTTAPVILGYDSAHSYTFDEALALFAAPNGFQWGANGTRINTDTYHH